MKNLFLFIFLALISCENSKKSDHYYANEVESNIINKMTCWTNYESENIMYKIVYTDDKEEKDKLFEKKFNLDELASNIGKENLKNDTIFINLIRNDSLLNEVKRQRKDLVDKILPFKKKVPFFEEYINIISEDIVEYEYLYHDEFGIIEYPPKKVDELSLPIKTFYKNYTEVLKENYKLIENSKIKEENIISLNELLKSLEEIDRKLWCVKYYFESKQNIETEEFENLRNKKVDSLLQ